jgi:hypothetical protein
MDAQDMAFGLERSSQLSRSIRERAGDDHCLDAGIGKDFFEIADGLRFRPPLDKNGGRD